MDKADKENSKPDIQQSSISSTTISNPDENSNDDSIDIIIGDSYLVRKHDSNSNKIRCIQKSRILHSL
jgi:hypothetical protein